MEKICEGLNSSAQLIHRNNVLKGFYDSKKNVGEMLMLVVTELSEAMEAHRKAKFSVPPIEPMSNEGFLMFVKDTFEDEIADAIIRLLDLSAYMKIDIEWHINQKVNYNTTREHLHGKKY